MTKSPPAPVDKDTFLLLKERLRLTGKTEIALISGSMSPFMKTGTKATIAPVKFDELASPDIIVFLSQEKLVCHCVWGHSVLPSSNGERMLITRGLASRSFDYPVRESEILGRVTSHRLSKLRFFWILLTSKFRLRSGD